MSINQPRHIRLTSHPEPLAHRWPIQLGRGHPGRARAGDRLGHPAGRPQRGRHPWRVLFALPRAGGLRRHALAAAAAGPGEYPSGDADRAASAVVASPARSSRSTPGAHVVGEDFGDAIGEGIDIRPTIAITKARLNMAELNALIATGELDAGRRGAASRRRRLRHQGRDRPGLVAARHRRAFRRGRAQPAPHPVRADRRHVPGTGHPARPRGLPAADRRHHRLYLRRPGASGRPPGAADLPGARRMQRLRRLRLRHLHLPALSHPRHRGERARRRRRAASGSSSTTARKAARWAR